MRWDKKIAFALGVLMLVGISLFFSSREPSYHGRNLSAWIEDYVGANYRVNSSGNMRFGAFDPAKASAAREAVIAIGTNAVPFLVSKISQKPVYEPLYKFFPELQRRRWFQQREGESGFRILGASAKSAIPELCALLGDDDEAVKDLAGKCLVLIGKDSIPGLLKAIRAAPRDGGLFYNLEELGTNAAPAIPTLVEWTADSDTNLVISACYTLGVLKMDSPLVVPALTKCLQTPNYGVRSFACTALAAYGSEARSAIPALTGMLDDPIYNISATWALKRIDPEAFASLKFKPLP